MVAARKTEAELSALNEALTDLPLRHGFADFARISVAFLNSHGRRFRLSEHPEPLSATEAAALRSVGVSGDVTGDAARPVIHAAANHAALVGTAMPLAEAAKRLGVTDGRLRQRVAEHTLLAVPGPDGRALRVPLFQLTESGELPGLRMILKAMRRELRPIQVAAFFTTPQSDLEDASGEAMTPVDWLLSGHDPAAVRDLAAGL